MRYLRRSGNVQTPDVQYLNCPYVRADPAFFQRTFTVKIITTDARFYNYQAWHACILLSACTDSM